VHKLGQLAN